MPYKRRPYSRESAVRDARLIVIATEDTKATVAYFKALKTVYKNRQVHVEVRQRPHTASDPAIVLTDLKVWIKQYQIGEEDELWLLIDVDRWGDAKLSQVAAECAQKGIRLAVSNPAIELWFLLHVRDVAADDDEEEKQALLANSKVNANRTYLEQAILDVVGSYNKSKLDVRPFLPHVEQAITRAEHLDTASDGRWPQQLGTRVYLVARSVVQSAKANTPSR